MGNIRPLYDNILLNCTITSDTHIDIKNPLVWLPKLLLKQSLKQAQNSHSRVDAYIIVGDVTSRGSKINWQMAKECFKKYNPAKNILLCLGNHDTWHDDGYDVAIENFLCYANEITGMALNKPYFSRVINGFSFIFLGSDADNGCAAHISDEQLEWFRCEMENASKNKKPVFVFCHQSLNGKHGLPRTWDKVEDPNADPSDGGIGVRSAEIESIMKAYENVFYFSGHSHMALCGEKMQKKEGYSSFERDENLELINMPCLGGENHHGEIRKLGTGVQLEVYSDKVIIRPRSFMRNMWLTGLNVRNSKPYLEVKY